MANETVNFSLQVNPAAPVPLHVADAGGNTLNDGDTVTLSPQTVGVNDPGQVMFTVSGGTPPYSFNLASGQIPNGDQLSSVDNPDGSETVSISGTPTTSGPATFAILIADAAGKSATVAAAPAKKPIGAPAPAKK